MGLQLKGDNGSNDLKPNHENENKNPWDYEKPLDNSYEKPVITTSLKSNTVNEAAVKPTAGVTIVKLIIALIVCGALILIGKGIASKALPEGEDITAVLKKSESAIAQQLGLTFTEDATLVNEIPQYSEGKVRVVSAEDVAVVYIDGRQMGVHMRTKLYRMYNVQVGMGEKEANENMTYVSDNFFSVLNDMAVGRTTTYFYYNMAQNDCLALTINNTTNRVVAVTYYYDYKKISETLEF